MTNPNDDGDEQFSQPLSIYDEAMFLGLGSSGARAVRRLGRRRAGGNARFEGRGPRFQHRPAAGSHELRRLRLLDEVWPRADQPQRLASEPNERGFNGVRYVVLRLLEQQVDRFEIGARTGARWIWNRLLGRRSETWPRGRSEGPASGNGSLGRAAKAVCARPRPPPSSVIRTSSRFMTRRLLGSNVGSLPSIAAARRSRIGLDGARRRSRRARLWNSCSRSPRP